MASIGHVAVGLALGRYEAGGASVWRQAGAMALLALLALLPDADVVGFKFGIAYAAPWGHRGASHSLVFAAAVTLVAMAVAGALRAPVGRWGALTFLAVASHGLLDSLTDGGLGAALLWPFSQERFFAPVQPLPVSPIGARMLSPRGLYVVGVELFAFLPFWAYALWPRGRRQET